MTTFTHDHPVNPINIKPAKTIKLKIFSADKNLSTNSNLSSAVQENFKFQVNGDVVYDKFVKNFEIFGKSFKFCFEIVEENDDADNLTDKMSNLKVNDATTNEFYSISSSTELIFPTHEVGQTSAFSPKVTNPTSGIHYDLIPDIIKSINFTKNSKNYLFHGVSGVGKSSVLKIIKDRLVNENANAVPKNSIKTINTIKILSGSSTLNLKSPSFSYPTCQYIFIDDLHHICNPDQTKNSALLSEFLDNNPEICLIASTYDVDYVHNLLRRPGRLDEEVEINVPSISDIKKILEFYEVPNFEEIALSMSGWVFADVSCFLKQVERLKAENIPVLDAYQAALKLVIPAAIREITVKIPNVKWQDIGGYEQVKSDLKKLIEWPIKHKIHYQKLNIKPPRGVLLYGPPGCSKTMLAKAVANESACNFISVKGSELFKKYVGESEKSVRNVFAKARRASPCVIFFDEIDALAVSRSGSSGDSGAGSGSGGKSSNVSDRVIAALLTELDGVDELSDVFVIAATNRPDIVDPALLRPGRFDKKVFINLPDEKSREKILKINLKELDWEELGLDEQYLGEMIQKCEGFSGSEIVAVCNEAKIEMVSRMIEGGGEGIDVNVLLEMCSRIKPVATDEIMAYYERLQ